jgi:hypothetical protein
MIFDAEHSRDLSNRLKSETEFACGATPHAHPT